MIRCIVLLGGLLCLACQGAAQARVLDARIERIDAAMATLHDVRVRLEWPAHADAGVLRVQAARVESPDLGYRLRDLAWECPLARDADAGWRCDGALRSGGSAPLRLAVDLGPASTDATLSQGAARLALRRAAATPDDTTLDLTRVPLAWAQALLSQGWEDGRLGAGVLDGRVRIGTPEAGPLRVEAELHAAGAAFDTAAGDVAGEGVDARMRVDYRKSGDTDLVGVEGALHGGALLFGNAFVDLPQTPLPLRVDAVRMGEGAGWRVPRFEWRDSAVLTAQGSAEFAPDATLRMLDIALDSGDASKLPARYLSGWLALAGLGGLRLEGTLGARIRIVDGDVRWGRMRLHGLDLHDGEDRFGFDGLDGVVHLTERDPIESELRWRGGTLRGLAFGPARWPLRSERRELRLREAVEVDMLGGRLRFDGLVLRPPAGGEGLRLQFGLAVQALEVARMAASLGWPEFRGSLSGEIPLVRYGNDRVDFDGGLSVRVFDGLVDVTSLSLERPFGVAPSLSADFALHELDLLAITEVFDFGSISGRLSGHIDRLRLVDWRMSAFDARLHTVRRPGVRQRISQRAVENISSVGDASFVTSLQGQLVGLFDDFGYARIGIGCRLANEVCRMGGLRSAGNAFTIVEGSGLPRLQVIGHNRDVDWPTLVERLGAVVGGEVAPVVE